LWSLPTVYTNQSWVLQIKAVKQYSLSYWFTICRWLLLNYAAITATANATVKYGTLCPQKNKARNFLAQLS